MCLTMHQNMKTFLDLQDTDLAVDLWLRIVPVGCPVICVKLNNQTLHQGALSHTLQTQRRLPLLDAFVITVELLEKNYQAEHETAAVIEQLSIDGFEIVPNYTQLATYSNDHGYDQPTNYVGFVGAWTLAVNRSFYQWRHQVTGQGLLLQLNQ